MPRLHHSRRDDPNDETPDWAWTPDEQMPADANLGRRHGDHPADQEHPLPLSPLQHQALQLLSLGLTADAIGAALCCDGHDAVKKVLRKLGARNGPHAVALALRNGLIE